MRISNEDKSGLYLTVILHLGALIVLLASQISSTIRGETSYLLDFTSIEQEEEETRETEFKESISDRLDELIAAASAAPAVSGGNEVVRNIAVDAGNRPLRDDRNTDAEQLYRDAERLDKELKSGAFASEDLDSDDYAAVSEPGQKETDSTKEVYTGPSVVSYALEGRKAVHLSIPAYRCMGGGDVTVRITVARSGKVENAEIVDGVSSADPCLRDYAKRAALLSRFTASESAPKKQFGNIVYRFIAQ